MLRARTSSCCPSPQPSRATSAPIEATRATDRSAACAVGGDDNEVWPQREDDLRRPGLLGRKGNSRRPPLTAVLMRVPPGHASAVRAAMPRRARAAVRPPAVRAARRLAMSLQARAPGLSLTVDESLRGVLALGLLEAEGVARRRRCRASSTRSAIAASRASMARARGPAARRHPRRRRDARAVPPARHRSHQDAPEQRGAAAPRAAGQGPAAR